MGRTVITRKTPSIHTKNHWQILQTDVVDDLIIRPLQEGRIDRTERLKPFGCHPCGKEHRMLFRDTHIEVSIQMFRLKPVQPRSVGHRPRDRHNPRIVICHLGKMIRKNLTVGRLPQRLGFARLRIIRSQSVKLLLLGHRGLVSLPLLRHHMKDHRKILNF